VQLTRRYRYRPYASLLPSRRALVAALLTRRQEASCLASRCAAS